MLNIYEQRIAPLHYVSCQNYIDGHVLCINRINEFFCSCHSNFKKRIFSNFFIYEIEKTNFMGM